MVVISIKLKNVILSIFVMLILIACAGTKPEPTGAIFEGESKYWRVVLEVGKLSTPEDYLAETDLTYTFSYIGEDPKPEVFSYEIDPESPLAYINEGSLDDQNEWFLTMSGHADPIYKITQIPITFKWDDKSEEVIIEFVKVVSY